MRPPDDTAVRTGTAVPGAAAATVRETAAQEAYWMASQWQLMWRKFRRHHLALVGGAVLILFYLLGIFCDFFSPYTIRERFQGLQNHPPSRIHWLADGRLVWPYVYPTVQTLDPQTFEATFTEITDIRYPIRFFTAGEEYRLLGLFRTRVRLYRVERPAGIFLFGTDALGRDLLSRTLCGARISLSIGLVGVAISFVLGVIFGGISGYFGGRADMLIQRMIEFIISIPTIPLWMGLAAALPKDWSVLRLYFGIVIILSLVRWGSLARVVRGKLLELREHDFTMAARLAGLRERAVIARHLLPSFASYLIVHLTLAIPDIILGETALSFLGLGLRSPAVSWGVLLKAAQNVRSVAAYPWMLIPALFVIVTVMAFMFVGDGLRDAADPYRQR